MEGGLVKRDEPLLVNTGDGEGAGMGAKAVLAKEAALNGGVHTNDVLNTLLPPLSLEDESGNTWKQFCSNIKSTRDDVFELQDNLDNALSKRQARNYGICPVREDLYSQCFDELLRQITLEMSERGLVLLRIRDEIRMGLSAYQTLYLNAVAFGTRKAVEAETTVEDLQVRVKELEKQRDRLKGLSLDLQDKTKVVESRETGKTQDALDQQLKERDFIQRQNAQLSEFLKTQQ